MKRGRIVIFSAPSGAGKTTIVKYLLGRGFNLNFSISATTREARDGEIEGKDYYFISVDEFKKKVANNEFLEWEEVYPGCCYGTLKSEVERARDFGKHVLFDVDVIGGINIKRQYGREALSIFVKPPSEEELRRRLEARATDSVEVIDKRMEKALHEMTYIQFFDIVIENSTLKDTFRIAEECVSEFLKS